MTSTYQHRPPEELYDVQADPHCLTNLIDDPSLAATRQELSGQLDAWMKSQGDQGAKTEELALTRQPRSRNPKEQNQKKAPKKSSDPS